MRWMLLVDTCGAAGSVAVADLQSSPPQMVAQRELPGRETQERLLLAIGEVLREPALHAPELDVLAVVTGPGSFTGVRIGLAAVKGLAEALGKPVVAISRLALLAAQTEAQGEAQAWLDAGRGDVFVGRYRDGVCLDERMMRREDAVREASHSEAIMAAEDSVAQIASRITLVPALSVREALPLAAAKVAAEDFADVALLDANYLRVPDAELARLAKQTTAGTRA